MMHAAENVLFLATVTDGIHPYASLNPMKKNREEERNLS